MVSVFKGFVEEGVSPNWTEIEENWKTRIEQDIDEEQAEVLL
jgi:hypothetical protein